ncbi:hypothetical protein H2198_006058 [Neophaeococcomyces mojaviensis]|uniref:Uncharacterized protein n=1 Tax=Neophaeococcomyces mojaviensis TaxID=3383035 RepID=A0ACC3A3Y3_9EURO|nr:hypothetical protein H2198_006058 [Knufia sp. JES_112]
MKQSLFSVLLGVSSFLSATGLAETIAEINGNRFISPYRNKDVKNVTGLVTAKGPDGFWIRSTRPDSDSRTSESLYIYDNSTVSRNLSTGSVISLNGRISEYRSSSTYIYLTELTRPSSVKVLTTGNKVVPVVIGSQNTTSPPTEQYTSLDKGDVFGLPNNSSQLSAANPILEPTKYGLDFWESLMGELVTVQKPVAIAKPNQYGDTWVVGDWKVSGRNSRGGLTLTLGDGNPEAIIIGDPLDGTNNPKSTKLGDTLGDITGVVYQAFGTYRILPLTKLSVTASKQPALPEPVSFKSDGTCKSLTIGDYNIENFAPNSTDIESRAEHIVKYLGSPDLVFLQEVQDNDGPTNDGVVDANSTLDVLVKAIQVAGGVEYVYVDIDPVNNEDGGQPGGNIRQAYLYNPEVLALFPGKQGSPTDAVQVIAGPSLSINPGRIEPNSTAWKDSRKPLAAHWLVKADNTTFFTINVHFTSKGGGTPIEGDARPPVNGGVDQRIQQANITADFIADILAKNQNSNIIMAGDCNEFAFVEPLKQLVANSGLVDLDEAANIDPVERYTYLFDMNSQELDHFFISKHIADQSPNVEHVHVNTWVSYADQISDHDPSVAQLNICPKVKRTECRAG